MGRSESALFMLSQSFLGVSVSNGFFVSNFPFALNHIALNDAAVARTQPR